MPHPLGSHLQVRRALGYTHHGIYVGGSWVVHYDGGPESKAAASIRRCRLATFADDGDVQAVRHRRSLPSADVVARAEGCIGEAEYNLFFNNCEHFATWCVTGKARSKQVDDVVDPSSGGLLVAAAVATGTVVAGPIGVVASLLGVGAWLMTDDE